jgi:hypothetical protein
VHADGSAGRDAIQLTPPTPDQYFAPHLPFSSPVGQLYTAPSMLSVLDHAFRHLLRHRLWEANCTRSVGKHGGQVCAHGPWAMTWFQYR